MSFNADNLSRTSFSSTLRQSHGQRYKHCTHRNAIDICTYLRVTEVGTPQQGLEPMIRLYFILQFLDRFLYLFHNDATLGWFLAVNYPTPSPVTHLQIMVRMSWRERPGPLPSGRLRLGLGPLPFGARLLEVLRRLDRLAVHACHASRKRVLLV